MTWDKQPFFAGTYYPAKGKYGMSGFADLLLQIREWWQMDRAALLRSAKQLMQHVQPNASASTSGDTSRLVSDAADDFKESFDPIYGGFGAAPKFPTPHNLLFLLYYSNVTQNQNCHWDHEHTSHDNNENLHHPKRCMLTNRQ